MVLVAFLLMLGIHAKNILWGMTKCPRVDATSETSNWVHSNVKGQIGAFYILELSLGFFYIAKDAIQIIPIMFNMLKTKSQI